MYITVWAAGVLLSLLPFLSLLSLTHTLTREKEMGDRYLKSEIKTLIQMYPSASKADIMAALPGRDWPAIGRYARYRLGLHRTRKAIGLAVLAGLAEGERKREEEGDIE